MQVMEFSKGSGSAIALSLAADNPEGFAEHLRQVKAVLLDWQAKNSDRCELVMLTIVSAPEHHPDIESLIEHVYRDDAELAPVLQSVSVQVALLNSRGKAVKEYYLGKPCVADPIRRKSWWPFW